MFICHPNSLAHWVLSGLLTLPSSCHCFPSQRAQWSLQMQILSFPTQWLPRALVRRPKPPVTLLLPCSGPLTRASDLLSFLLPQGWNIHLHCFLFAQLIPSHRSRRAHLNRCTSTCSPQHCLASSSDLALPSSDSLQSHALPYPPKEHLARFPLHTPQRHGSYSACVPISPPPISSIGP